MSMALPSMARKRKRSTDDEVEKPGSLQMPDHEDKMESSDTGSDSDDELDGVEAHEDDLKALAEKDPEFYKFLEENDAELLDFGQNGDASAKRTKSKKEKQVQSSQDGAIEEMDVEDSDDAEEDINAKTDDLDVTPARIARWKAAMMDQDSLRSMKEVVAAFRASAHVDEDDGKAYKYSISSPEGMSSSRSAEISG